MLGKTNPQKSFWDSEWIEHLIDKESFEYHFRKVVRPMITDNDFAWIYSPDRGRKAIPPSLVACALILQQKYKLSDREMERQVRFHLATKYALGLPMDDAGFDHTVLCKFRKMLVDNEQTRMCFDRFKHALRDAGLIRADEIAIIDTTHVIADIAIPNTIALVRSAMKDVLKGSERIRRGMSRDLLKVLELNVMQVADSKVHLTELVHAARRLIEYLEKSGDVQHKRIKNEVSNLKRIINENTREVNSGRGNRKVIEEHRGPIPNRLVSTVDPDARHGRKSKTKKFTGYKAQIIESENEFILAVEGMLGNRHDTWKVFPMVNELTRWELSPSYLVGDKAYADETLGIDLEGIDVKMVAPLKKEPAGRNANPVNPSPSFIYRQRRKAFNQTSLYNRLMAMRYKIEQKNAQLKRQLGLKRCRYRGLPKFNFQCYFAALVANIQRWITLSIHAPPGRAYAQDALV